MSKLLTLSILISAAVRAVVVTLTSFILALKEPVVANLVILLISPLTSFVLAFRVVLVAKLVTSDILSSIFFILALYTSFSKTSFFTTSLSLPKSTGTGTNLSTSNLSTLLFQLLELVGTFLNLLIPNLSKLDFKLAKSIFLAKFYVSRLFAFCKSAFSGSGNY